MTWEIPIKGPDHVEARHTLIELEPNLRDNTSRRTDANASKTHLYLSQILKSKYWKIMTCPNCAEGFVLPGDPTGSIQPEYDGAYHAVAPMGESKQAVVLLTDGFGLELKNCKILADKLSRRLGCDVWVPDYFKGEQRLFVAKCIAEQKLYQVDPLLQPQTCVRLTALVSSCRSGTG
jgi:hypothetical protein